jgi:hypothetical protein
MIFAAQSATGDPGACVVDLHLGHPTQELFGNGALGLLVSQCNGLDSLIVSGSSL